MMDTLESLKLEMMQNALKSTPDSRSVSLDDRNIILYLKLHQVGARKFLKLAIKDESLDQSIVDQVVEVFFPNGDYLEIPSTRGVMRQFVKEVPYD
jgi:hypothetical protein